MNVKCILRNLDTAFQHFDERGIITIEGGVVHADDKRPSVHYWSCSYWGLPLQHRCNSITPTKWITDTPCIQIDMAKGDWRKQSALILYLCLMNICGTMAANVSGDSLKAGGKSFYGELNKDGSFSVLAIERWPDVMPFHGVLSLLNFQILWRSQKNSSSVQQMLLIAFVSWLSPLDVITLISEPMMEICHRNKFKWTKSLHWAALCGVIIAFSFVINFQTMGVFSVFFLF